MAQYTPNFNDPRVVRRCKHSLGFALSYLTCDKPRGLSQEQIIKHIGQGQNPLSAWLKSQLLDCTDSHWNMATKKVKKYQLNTAGSEYLKQILGYKTHRAFNSSVTPAKAQRLSDHQIAVDWAHTQYSIDTDYTDKSHRLWHPVQNIRSEIRNSVLRDNLLTHQYDIVCASPTLLHQYSWRFSGGHYLETIGEYTENRNAIRQTLAREIEVPVKTIKAILNAMFCGAVLKRNPFGSIYKLVDYDSERITQLQQDPWMKRFKQDIFEMWQYLRPVLEKTPELRVTETGKTRRLVMYPTNKWNLYFQLERMILNAVRQYLDEQNLKYFLIHDAFASEQVEIEHVIEHITKTTAFDICFEETVLI